MVVKVGPATIAVEWHGRSGRWSVDALHGRFLSATAQPDLTLIVHHGSCAPPAGRLSFKLGEQACFYRDAASWIIRLGEDDGATPIDRTVTLHPSGSFGTLVMHVDQFPMLARRYPLEYPLEDILFRHLLADHRSVLIHACGVSWRGRGYLFVGSSGAGKSTIACLWKEAGAAILNDDRIVLEASDTGLLIHPTPWSGTYPEVDGESVPLAAIYLIRKGAEVAFEPLRPVSALALLYAKAFPPLWDHDKIAANLETLARACRKVPCGWLTVPPDQRAIAWVEANG
jgi:hypothetical protein